MSNKINKYILIVAIFISISISSCQVFQPSKMLRTGPNYEYSDFPGVTENEYKIAPNDVISFRLFTNNGFKLIDLTVENRNQQTYNQNEFTVESDGLIKLPVIGRVQVSGKTIREAEEYLEKLYSEFYNNPFAILKVTNKRIYLFPGKEGSARIYYLTNNNTTLMEVLAEIGGISDGKANKIKIIRGDLKKPDVFIIDLSSIKGMQKANLVLQANDIIYIEPRDRYVSRAIEALNPYLTALSTLTTLLVLLSVSK